MKFYVCDTCKNVVEMVVDHRIKPFCCGKPMTELVANTVDAAKEKHIPVVTLNGDLVEVVVGSVLHPQTEAHLINFIVVETTNGVYRKDLTPEDEPKASFKLQADEKVVNVYAYCNLHGLWKARL